MRVGTIALSGRPNVGKSTLLNKLAGENVAITSPKPETTRDRLVAVVTREDVQAIFVDVPGVHNPRARLGHYMNREAMRAVHDADVVLMVTDVHRVASIHSDAIILEALSKIERPVVLAINKCDQIDHTRLLPLLDAFKNARTFADIVPVSAETGEGLDVLFRVCSQHLPEGEMLYPVDALTDRPERYLAAERVRQAIFAEMEQELPYVAAVEIEQYDVKAPVLTIRATIHVERDGQKKILVGKAGAGIKAVGTRARTDIEAMVGRQVFLELWVKVTPGWTQSDEALARLGYRDEIAPVKKKTKKKTGGTAGKAATKPRSGTKNSQGQQD